MFFLKLFSISLLFLGFICFLLALVPGLPKIPFILLAVPLISLGALLRYLQINAEKKNSNH